MGIEVALLEAEGKNNDNDDNVSCGFSTVIPWATSMAQK